MKAAVFREHDKDPEKVVKIEDIDIPKIKPNEVLVKVEATSYNYNDLWAIWGRPIKVPMPHISGTDISGIVEEVGEEVTSVRKGDRVVSHGNLSCRICNLCTSGREYDCEKRQVWGFQTGPLWGGYCQYAHLPEVNIVKISNNISFEDAAAISMVGMTSWHMLVDRARIKPGQDVLIMGGTSGVGMVGIQIAKLHNCNVIATAGNKQKMDKCLELGADHVVNHREADWYKKVRGITNKKGVDIVFEHIGKTVFPQAVALLKMGGTLVSTGATTGYDSTIDLRYLFFRGINIVGATQGTRAELEDMLYWTANKKIKPLINAVLPFQNMVKGHVMMMNGDQIGKTITTPQKL
ncbi:zinc-binding dehydrogenase [Candidatus Nitrosocosmicus franklandus]|uniref:Crotonyl-CoA reductase n=1 Tax=Candidatus Nitrosocosmicus franklandianus TaxID=1798806 RepID=A0A484IGJ9_9ARCH|nr:zinc-binding dehydrogenase [Candidatus Nitrosocosmicus franklandus]VFJ14784.1 Crotonyl-CoA reductase [Candidatus Nitrosocosmicus franklandus]